MGQLIIGGAGFIGVNLVSFLLDQGNEVSVYHRKSTSLTDLKEFEFKSIIGELNDEETLKQAIGNCKVVYNLAACTSSLKKESAQRQAINVVAARDIARIAREAGVRLVHVSSIAAVGSPEHGAIADESQEFNWHQDPYAVSKHYGDLEVLKEVALGLNAVIACPGNVVGGLAMKQGQKNNFRAIANGSMKFYPSGGVCLTDVDDLVRGIALCGEKGAAGRRFILGGHNVNFKEYFEEIAVASGGLKPWIRLPGFLLPLAGWGLEIIFGILGKEPPLNRNTGEVVSRNLYYSSQLAIDELGYEIGDWRLAIKKATLKSTIAKTTNPE
jgi:dihydroflavonol-4-reductase